MSGAQPACPAEATFPGHLGGTKGSRPRFLPPDGLRDGQVTMGREVTPLVFKEFVSSEGCGFALGRASLKEFGEATHVDRGWCRGLCMTVLVSS